MGRWLIWMANRLITGKVMIFNRSTRHKYFSHDSDHVVHPGFLASMHKYKDHFKTLHAYYEKQRTDLWLHGSHHSMTSKTVSRDVFVIFYFTYFLYCAGCSLPHLVWNFFIYLLLKVHLYKNGRSWNFRLLQNSKKEFLFHPKNPHCQTWHQLKLKYTVVG